MNLAKLMPLLLLAACSSGPTEQESVVVFGATTSAMATAQGRAVADTSGSNGNLSFTGPCTLGGSVTVVGSYEGADTGDRAVFDLETTFDGCQELTGTLDGNLKWTSVADGSSFSASMTGSIDFDGSNTSASCDFNLQIDVTSSSVNYAGSMCGYDVQADLGIRTGS